MKYYITKNAGNATETTRQDYCNKARRKGATTKTWTQDGVIIAREVIMK